MRAQRFAEKSSFNPQRCRMLGINAAVAREAAALAEQFLRIARDEGLRTEARDTSSEALQRCILAGFPDQVALRLDAGTLRCALVHNRRGVLARESVVEAPLLVASEVREIEIRGGVETLLSLATAIRSEWLKEFFPEAFEDRRELIFDAAQRRVVARHFTRFRDLVLSVHDSDDLPADEAATILAREVVAGTCPLKNWNNDIEQWILRLNLLSQWCPELHLPALTADNRVLIIEQVCEGATSYREIKEREVWPVVRSWLPARQQQLLEEYVPERIELPGGRKAKIIYAENAEPVVAARIQDLYGVRNELRIARGRVPLVIQVLAPNHRPIQVTKDLSTFWKEGYPRIKQELQRKYPKHEWR